MTFRQRVEALVRQIPTGHVMTYGQIAALCGSPRAARIVGGIAHFGDPDLPWHRVVMKDGDMASGFPGGKKSHRKLLIDERVSFRPHGKVMMDKHQWSPK